MKGIPFNVTGLSLFAVKGRWKEECEVILKSLDAHYHQQQLNKRTRCKTTELFIERSWRVTVNFFKVNISSIKLMIFVSLLQNCFFNVIIINCIAKSCTVFNYLQYGALKTLKKKFNHKYDFKEKKIVQINFSLKLFA